MLFYITNQKWEEKKLKNVLKKGIAFTLALTSSVSSANVSLFITKANQQAEEKSNVKSTTVYNNKNEIVSQSFVDYDGRTVKELSNGLYIDYTYDASGRVFTEYTNGTNQNNPSGIDDGKLIVKTYDEKGNQTATITNPEISGNTLKVGKDSIVTTNEYNQNGNLIKSTDGEGNQTKYEYDEQGRTTKVITPSDATNTYSYDELIKDGNDRGVVDTVTDALGRVSKTTNNGSDQITKIEDIASTKSIVKTYEYDSNGRQTKEIYSDGSYIQNTYEDATGELIKSTRIDDSGNVEGYTQYEYTVDDKVKSAIDYKSGKPYRYTYYEYDAYGRNTGVAEINATSTPTTEKIKDSMIKYVYDGDDNIIKIYYPNSSKDKLKGIKFIYNKDKWITEIDGILSGGDDDTTVIRKYDYYSNAKVRTIRDYKRTAELLARVRAALRASRNRARVAPSNLFTVDDLVIDYDRRQVSVGGSPVHLTQTEYNILALLSQHTGKVLTYATIIRSVWGSMDDGSVKKLQVNMANIRKKLGCRPGDGRYVINELGVGYRIADE